MAAAGENHMTIDNSHRVKFGDPSRGRARDEVASRRVHPCSSRQNAKYERAPLWSNLTWRCPVARGVPLMLSVTSLNSNRPASSIGDVEQISPGFP